MDSDTEFLVLQGRTAEVQQKLNTLHEFDALAMRSDGDRVMRVASCRASCCLSIVVLVLSEKMSRNLRGLIGSIGDDDCART